jgi:uncharacterized protein (DUF1501 family)
MLSRRSFLQSTPLLALAPTVPAFLAGLAHAARPERDARVLVVVQMDGGNDALNTVVPHADPEYARLRPRLKLAANDLVKINDGVGLHSSLKPLGRLLEKGQLAVIPGVGYPNPNRSHFRSMAIWHTAKFDPEEHTGYGWLGRALDSRGGSSALVGVGDTPVALRGRRSTALSLASPNDLLLSDAATAKQALQMPPQDDLLAFVHRQATDGFQAATNMARLGTGSNDASYPSAGLAERLQLVARLLRADLGTRVFYTVQSGYDTHAAQSFTHANLLGQFAGAVQAFFSDLEKARLAERVTLLAFSEFGRTIKENGSAGTDHGTTGCVFVAGPDVKGGLIGSLPSLTSLEQGEPKMTTDFRSIYATLLDGCLGVEPRNVLGTSFEKLPLLKA